MKTTPMNFRIPYFIADKMNITSAISGKSKTDIVISALKNYLGIGTYEQNKWIPTDVIFGVQQQVLIKTNVDTIKIAEMVNINGKYYWECQDGRRIMPETVKSWQLLPK